MGVTCSFTFPSSTTGRGKAKLSRSIQKSIDDFFKHCQHLPSSLAFVINEITPGGKQGRFVTMHPDPLDEKFGTRVKILTEGTQCAIGYLTSDSLDHNTLRTLIEAGPYTKREQEVIPERQLEVAEFCEEVTTMSIPLPATKPEKSASKLSPYTYLVQQGVQKEEIERLRATMASIVSAVWDGTGDPTNTAQVPVETITKCILGHMGIPTNTANNYRGVIGSFYSARISLFGYKFEGVRLGESSRYTDWVLDVDLILSFVGGKNDLARLARERAAEVQRQAEVEAQTPVSATQLEEPLSDSELMRRAATFQEQRRRKQEEVAKLEENGQSLKELLCEYEAEVMKIKEDIINNANRIAEANNELEQLRLPEHIRQELQKALMRIQSLLSE